MRILNSNSPDARNGRGQMLRPKVSLVIPTFNQGKYLPTTLDWILHQSYPNLEIVIVDGGSTDNTKAFLRDFENRVATDQADFLDYLEMGPEGRPLFHRRQVPKYPREGREVKIVTFDHDIGAVETYNEGFRRITGELCTYIVGDDIPHPDMISRMTDVLCETGADFAYADTAIVDDAGRINMVLRKPEYSFEACFAQWFHLGVCRLYRAEWHRRVGLFDPNYSSANDYDMYLRFAMKGCTFVHVPEVLYSIRWHGLDRRTGQHTPERERDIMSQSVQCALRARDWLRPRQGKGRKTQKVKS